MDGTFEEGPVCIVDSRDQVLRCKTVRLVLALRCKTYPFLFRDEST